MPKSKIEWTERTINPIRAYHVGLPGKRGHFCMKVSPACANCYASAFQPRMGLPEYDSRKIEPLPIRDNADVVDVGRGLRVEIDDLILDEVQRRRKPSVFFWCSMTDLFGDWVPDDWILRCFNRMVQTPRHRHLVLTKRPERMLKFFQSFGPGLDPYVNIALGVTAENQKTADERIPHLLECPAAVRFLSCEPMLGAIDLHLQLDRIHWVIAGGESGPKARPSHPDWFRSLRDQCQAAKVPFFFKQHGEYMDATHDEAARSAGTCDLIILPSGKIIGAGYRSGRKYGGMVDQDWEERGAAWMAKVGKKAAGRLLDGEEWNQVPEALQLTANS